MECNRIINRIINRRRILHEKECLKNAIRYIDEMPDIKKAIQHQLDLIRSAKVIDEDEYIAMGD